MSLGFVLREENLQIVAFADELCQRLLKQYLKLQLHFLVQDSLNLKILGHFEQRVKVLDPEKFLQNSNAIVAIGGDGTFLRAVSLMRFKSLPIMGIHMGRLGFLTEIKPQRAFDLLSRFIENQRMSTRCHTQFEVSIERNHQIESCGLVLNEAMIGGGSISRLVDFELLVNNKFFFHARADGMLVSTPTGSTAYALAAGGPIIEPNVSGMLVLPICAHQISLRPLIVSDQNVISIHLAKKMNHVFLVLDGNRSFALQQSDKIHIKKFKEHTIVSIIDEEFDYIDVLKEKLHFGCGPEC